MKRLLTIMFAMTVFTVMANAQYMKSAKVTEDVNASEFRAPVMYPNLHNLSTPKYPGDKPLVDAFIDTVRDASFSFYSFVTPVVYETNSKTLIQVQNERYIPMGGTDLHGSIYVKYSTNNGMTWTKKIFWDIVNQIPVYPSIAVTNPTNKTNPLDFNYVISGPLAKESGGQYPWYGDFWLLVNGQTSTDPLEYDYPIQGQRWWTTRAAANVNNGEEIFYNVGTLSNQPGKQYGYYGNSAFNMTIGDFNAQNSPAQWDPSKFRSSTDLNSSYNDYLYIDVDDMGGTYVGVKNMFVDETDIRVPAVSKSTDGGTTWSEFDRLPSSLLTNYYNVYGGTTQSFIISYSSDGFVVWGVDSWSFLFRTVINKGNNEYEYHITEAYKTGGTWQLRKVADWSGFNQLVMSDVGTNPAYKDSIQVSRLGGELQIVKTADKKHLIAKWVDYNDDTLMVTPAILINNGLDTLGVINSNDVYMATRNLSTTTWSQPVNVTMDKAIDKCTYLPLTVQDLEHVPLFQLSTFITNYTDPNHPRKQYPQNAWSIIVDSWQGVGFTNVNVSGGPISVEEENYNFSVNEIVPNPATDITEFTFSLDNAGNVNIEIFNALGQKVSNVINTFMDAGMHGLNIDVSSFVNGNYYIRLTNNGHSVTKALRVIR